MIEEQQDPMLVFGSVKETYLGRLLFYNLALARPRCSLPPCFPLALGSSLVCFCGKDNDANYCGLQDRI
jgi:hypothetical protein